MARERNQIDTLQARIDAMIAEFRAARERRLVKLGMGLWNRTELAPGEVSQAKPPPTKLN